MSIKTILLHLNDDSHNNGAIDAALGLAVENGAHVSALYTSARTIIPASYMGYVPPEMIERSRQLEAEKSSAAKARLEELAAKVGCSVEVFIEEGYAPDLLNNHALAADIVVLGRSDPDTDSGGQLRHIAEEIVVSSPRPVLVIPNMRQETFGKRILVGWNNSRESSRAIHEAMPFLEKADMVTLLQVNSTEDENFETRQILSHLARHGVKAEFKSGYWPDIDVGDAMLGALVDYSCDMLVMGAYGRSRIREMILGGATRTVLAHMTAPTLFAH
ncbi:universal stress protein [Sneathiella sp.]|uniref:universal stress protein n=1 Tax=Sneathiella sp. TaxID=1964365 RepID=UPI002FE12505